VLGKEPNNVDLAFHYGSKASPKEMSAREGIQSENLTASRREGSRPTRIGGGAKKGTKKACRRGYAKAWEGGVSA